VRNEPKVAKKHTIACVKHPNGTLTAEENIVYVPFENVEEEVKVERIPGTARVLPITKQEAEEWARSVMLEAPQDTIEAMIKRLCGEDLDWTVE